MPCMELFDRQPEDYQKDILEENSLIITLEAGSITSWQKYIKNKIIKDDTRITLCLPFINNLIEKKAKIIIISHLGRPKGINIP